MQAMTRDLILITWAAAIAGALLVVFGNSYTQVAGAIIWAVGVGSQILMGTGYIVRNLDRRKLVLTQRLEEARNLEEGLRLEEARNLEEALRLAEAQNLEAAKSLAAAYQKFFDDVQMQACRRMLREGAFSGFFQSTVEDITGITVEFDGSIDAPYSISTVHAPGQANTVIVKVRTFNAEVVAAGVEEQVALLLPLQVGLDKLKIRERANALNLAFTWEAMFLSDDSVYSRIGLTRDMVMRAVNALHDKQEVTWADDLARKASLNAAYHTNWSQKQVWFMEAVLWMQGQRVEIPNPTVAA